MDMMRRFILMRIAVEAESKLGPPVLSAAAKASQNGSSREFQTLADLQHLRAFMTGPVLLTMLDAPVTPVYLLAVFLIHPDLGFIVLGTGDHAVSGSRAQPALTAVPFTRANAYGDPSQSAGRRDGAQRPGDQRHGHDSRRCPVWGRETREVPEGAGDRAGPQHHDDGRLRSSSGCRPRSAMLGWGALFRWQAN